MLQISRFIIKIILILSLKDQDQVELLLLFAFNSSPFINNSITDIEVFIMDNAVQNYVNNGKWFDWSTFGKPNLDPNMYGDSSWLLDKISMIGEIGVYVSIIVIAVGFFCLIFNFRKPLKWGFIGFGISALLSLV
jgi:hypothetical protein